MPSQKISRVVVIFLALAIFTDILAKSQFSAAVLQRNNPVIHGRTLLIGQIGFVISYCFFIFAGIGYGILGFKKNAMYRLFITILFLCFLLLQCVFV